MNEVFIGVVLFVIFVFITIFMFRIWTPVLEATYSTASETFVAQEQRDITNNLKVVWQYAPFMFLVLFIIYVIYLASKREQYEYGI